MIQSGTLVRWPKLATRLIFLNGEEAAAFAHLEKRARRKFERTASSPWEADDVAAFYRLRDRVHLIRSTFEIVIKLVAGQRYKRST